MNDKNIEKEMNEIFDYPFKETFSEWEEIQKELFIVRILADKKIVLNIITDFITWCNKYVPYLKDVHLFKDGDHYYVSGKIVDDKGLSIYKELHNKWKEEEVLDEDEIRDYGEDLFGFVDIIEILDNYYSPVEVRIVSLRKRMVSFWGVLIRHIRRMFYLDYLKPERWLLGKDMPGELDKNTITHEISLNDYINTVRVFPPGRKPDKAYDRAFERIQGGMQPVVAFQFFLREGNIKFPDKNVRDAFGSAIKRRRNKS